jgi:hypothetical protein
MESRKLLAIQQIGESRSEPSGVGEHQWLEQWRDELGKDGAVVEH